MKLLILLILSMLMISCASVTKENVTDKHFSVKEYDLNYRVRPFKVYMIHQEKLDQNCFLDVDDREIYTVPEEHASFAIDHFYKRFINVDVKVVKQNGTSATYVKATESANFDLEVFDCIVETKYWFITNKRVYTSFRMKR